MLRSWPLEFLSAVHRTSEDWIATAQERLAMTGRGSLNSPRHCERSAAIQGPQYKRSFHPRGSANGFRPFDSIALKHRLHLVGKRLEGAGEVLRGHAQRL